MRSAYNNATVHAVTWTGPPTTLSWELQHSLCAAAGRATPGSSSGHGDNDKYCAYSLSDNHVVTRGCNWAGQRFTHVSGTLGGGVGYMCAHRDCNMLVRVEGTRAAGQWRARGLCLNDLSRCREGPASCRRDPSCEDSTGIVTLNSGDAVFCSA